MIFGIGKCHIILPVYRFEVQPTASLIIGEHTFSLSMLINSYVHVHACEQSNMPIYIVHGLHVCIHVAVHHHYLHMA